MTKTISQIAVKDIIPDKDQPRRNFNATRLADLRKSIEKHGIMNPLVVEKVGNNYLLVDGERRYRVATDLKLKQVPAIVYPSQDKLQRLIQQFHIQEQHENWTGIEKAAAMYRLAKELKIDYHALGEMLNIPPSSTSRYLAFASLMTQKEFEKNEIPIEYVTSIRILVGLVKNLYDKVLDKEFNKADQYALELAVIRNVREGTIGNKGQILQLRDTFSQDPRLIQAFMKSNSTDVVRLFSKSKAKAAQKARQVYNYSANMSAMVKEGMALGFEPFFELQDGSALTRLKNLQKQLERLINSLEK